MGLISKKRPLSYLFIIAIEIVIGILAIIGGFAIDMAIYNPPDDVASFPFPLFMGIFMLLSAAIISVSFIIVVIWIIYLYIKRGSTSTK